MPRGHLSSPRVGVRDVEVPSRRSVLFRGFVYVTGPSLLGNLGVPIILGEIKIRAKILPLGVIMYEL